MTTRLICLLAAAGLALPLPALADCAERIAAVESDPALGQGKPAETAAGGDESVREDGGVTQHAEGGPAAPQESWFTDARTEDEGTALTYLDEARKAQQAGDEKACLEAVEQAEAALSKG